MVWNAPTGSPASSYRISGCFQSSVTVDGAADTIQGQLWSERRFPGRRVGPGAGCGAVCARYGGPPGGGVCQPRRHPAAGQVLSPDGAGGGQGCAGGGGSAPGQDARLRLRPGPDPRPLPRRGHRGLPGPAGLGAHLPCPRGAFRSERGTPRWSEAPRGRCKEAARQPGSRRGGAAARWGGRGAGEEGGQSRQRAGSPRGMEGGLPSGLRPPRLGVPAVTDELPALRTHERPRGGTLSSQRHRRGPAWFPGQRLSQGRGRARLGGAAARAPGAPSRRGSRSAGAWASPPTGGSAPPTGRPFFPAPPSAGGY